MPIQRVIDEQLQHTKTQDMNRILYPTTLKLLVLIILVAIACIIYYKGETSIEYLYPSCGQICDYNSGVKLAGKLYPFIMKKLSCRNILIRWASPRTAPPEPPQTPPASLFSQFTQNGESPIKSFWYFNDVGGNNTRKFTRNDMEEMIQLDSMGANIGTYEEATDLKSILKNHAPSISGKRALVIGTQKPWIETMLVRLDVKSIATVDYQYVYIEQPQVVFFLPQQLALGMIKSKVKQFDIAVSFSSVEHSGLGRYSDPLDPYGDLEAVAQVWCSLKPGGLFFLGVPTSEDGSSYIIWNAHRVYGKSRLQQLTANWHVLDAFQGKGTYHHGIFVLQKPYDSKSYMLE